MNVPPLAPDLPERTQEPDVLFQVFEQTPAAICLLRGPEHRLDYHNPAYQALFPGRDMRGRFLADIQPEAATQGFVALLDRVYQTGETFFGQEMRIDIDQLDGGATKETYFNFTYQAYYESGQIAGISVFAYNVTEQVRRRQQTERQRRVLYQLYQEVPAAMCILDGPNHVYELVNPSYEQLFPGRALLGKPLLEALPELAHLDAYRTLRRVYETGVTHRELSVCIALPRYAGGPPEDRYFDYIQQARYDAEGHVDGVLVFNFEVTEQVQARQQAEQSEARFRRLAEATPMVVWEADAQGQTTYLSPHWEQFTTSANGKGLGWQDFVHPDDQDPFLQTWLAAVGSAQPFQAEMRLRVAATGEYRWHLDRAVPVLDAAGEVTQWVGAAIDIHELKHLQQTLLESEQYFRQMADHVPAMLWVTDAQGQCTYLNQQWYAFTGQTQANALGYGWLGAVHPDDAEATDTAFREASSHQKRYQVVYRLRRHDGEYHWAIDAALPRFDAAGRFTGMVGVVLDVHERQLAEQDLQRLTQQLSTTNEQLTRTNVDLDNFIYTASHDLKSPIANIEGLVNALHYQLDTHRELPAEVPALLRMMHVSVERFKRTLDSLTDITKLQKEHDQPTIEVALQPVIDDVLLDLQPLIQQQGARVEVDLTSCRAVSFTFKNLRSVVYNLLSNALKYRHPDRPPHVQLRCRRDGAHTVLSVQDNGLGLDPARQAQLFGMFRRFHSHVEGSGIGLYMVKRAVENAGGRVEVSSEPGQGSTFSIYFR